MSFPTQLGVALVFGIVLSSLPAAAAEDKQITLMLGGQFCEFYPDNIKKALTELSGVKAVDLTCPTGRLSDGSRLDYQRVRRDHARKSLCDLLILSGS